MTTVLVGLGTLALGSLLTLLVQSLVYRTNATQTARRELLHAPCTSAALTPAGDGTDDVALRSEAIRRMGLMTDRLEAAQDAIGARIRELYAT
jgi:hypothetical protein